MDRLVSVKEVNDSDSMLVSIGDQEITISDQEIYDIVFLRRAMKRKATFYYNNKTQNAQKRELKPGDIFGRLTYLEYSHTERLPSDRSDRYMLCLCECGVKARVRTDRLLSGKTKSCGCDSLKI